MPTINEENLKPIRKAFDVRCGLVSKIETELQYYIGGDIQIYHDSFVDELNDSEAPVKLADLSNGGFPLDGSVRFYDSSSSEKIGVKGFVDGGVSLSVISPINIEAVTIKASGSGTLFVYYSEGVEEFEIRDLMVVPVEWVSASEFCVQMEFVPDAGYRIGIDSVTAGITLEFDNSNLVSVSLDLASDLSLDPSFEVSSIEVQAYWPDDISEIISNVGEEVPIWYYAGYEGDYSQTRYFYLSEKATMRDNLITIKGEDSSSKLETFEIPSQVIGHKQNNGFITLYHFMKNAIENSGIKLKNIQYDPPVIGRDESKHYLIVKKTDARAVVADLMNICRETVYYPTFVDAGIPTIRWSKPNTRAMFQADDFTIYESDCGECVREADRNVNRIIGTDEEFSILTNVKKGAKQEIASQDLQKNQKASSNFSDYYMSVSISNSKNAIISADGASWRAVKNGKSVVKGNVMNILNVKNTINEPTGRPGTALEIEPEFFGRIYYGDNIIFPNYENLFERSNITGAFDWKGDPRMQPRDVFKFVRLDGTEEICTVERINLKHEEGGTIATISYRLGVC